MCYLILVEFGVRSFNELLLRYSGFAQQCVQERPFFSDRCKWHYLAVCPLAFSRHFATKKHCAKVCALSHRTTQHWQSSN